MQQPNRHQRPGQVQLTAVDVLHSRWREFTATLDEADKTTLRHHTLRKHAIPNPGN